MRTASAAGIAIPTHLPLLDSVERPRSAGEVVSRLFAAHVTAACAYGLDRTSALTWVRVEGLEKDLTPSERAFLFEKKGIAGRFQAQVEGMWVLAWSCGLISSIDMKQPCDDRFATMLPDLKVGQRSDAWRRKADMLPLHRLFCACDLAYALHWATRQAALEHRPCPLAISADLIAERRRALEWILGEDSWDEVTLDT